MRPILSEFVSGISLGDGVPDGVSRLLSRHGCGRTLEHSQRVAAEATRLARRWRAGEAQAATTGWLHDISAIIPAERRIAVAEAVGLEVLPEERAAPLVIHQKLSAALAQEVFGITDPEIVSAIGCHTTLKAGASRLDKILFVADKIEWDRMGEAPYQAEMVTAAEQSLDQAAAVYLRYLWAQRDTLAVVHPWMAEAYAELVRETQQEP
jgi:predicted HD superfamily hydrolase involved in NAD metabolism